MSFVTSLHTVLHIARITLPTVGESLVGRVTREACDRRLQQFALDTTARADMDLRVTGRDHIARDRSYVFMSNHQSHMDIPVLYASLPVPTLRMVAKTELFGIPILGRAMRAAGFVEVDRGNRGQAVASLRRAQDTLESGVSIWIAPEGSRTRDGRLGALKKGGFHLAVGTRTPIVPVAVSGTYQVLPPGTRSTRKGMPVDVVIGEPISVEGKSLAELVEQVASFLKQNASPIARQS